MYMNKIKFRKSILVLVLLITSAAVQAKPYVSLAGEFYVNLPDDWEQIDFNTVDMFLARNNVSEKQFGYDAVLAPSTNSPFFDGNYLLIRLDTVGELSAKDLDTLLQSLAYSFNQRMRYFPIGDYLTDISTNHPNYDKANRLITMYSEVTERGKAFKKSLLMKKIYHRGVASFYFYSNDSLFDSSLVTFQNIIESFSTENIEAQLPTENIVVVETKKIEKPDDGDSSMLAIYVALGVVLIIVIRKRRSKKNQS